MAKERRVDGGEEPLPKPSLLATNDRLTVVLRISHEHLGDKPMGLSPNFSTMLGNQEQAYQRRIKVTQDWALMDMGWLQEQGAAVVLLENLVGKERLVNPTDEELADDAKRIIEVSVVADSEKCDVVPPGRFYLGFPCPTARLQYRCQHKTAVCRLTLIPR